MKYQLNSIIVSLCAVFLTLILASNVQAQSGSTQVSLLNEYDSAPDGAGGIDGTYDRFLPPVLNDASEAAFAAYMDTYWNGLFRTDGTQTVLIARSGQSAPNAAGAPEGFFTDFSNGEYAINDSGQVAFENRLDDASGVFLAEGLWVGDGAGLVQIARQGDPAPDGNGTIYRFYRWYFNDNGAVAFAVSFDGTTGGTSDNSAVLVGDGTSLVTLAREGMPAPGPGNPVYVALSSAYTYITEDGMVFFNAGIEDQDGRGYTALFIYDGSTTRQVARKGDGAPGGGTFRTISEGENFNDSGQVSFHSGLDGTADEAFFRADLNGISEIAREGDSVLDLGGNPDGVISDLPSNGFFVAGNGDMFFSANVSGSTTGYSPGLFRGTGNTNKAVLYSGGPSPDGSDFFGGFGSMGANERGQLLVDSTLNSSTGVRTDRALYLHDPNAGLFKVARSSDALGVYDVAGIGAKRTDEFNGLNEKGQVAYTYENRFGTMGIALFDPGDIYPPVIGPLNTAPETPGLSDNVLFTAVISDYPTNGSTVVSAEYRIDDGEWQAMSATDGAFDETTEETEAEVGVLGQGEFEICARATDALGWTSDPTCLSLIIGGGEPTELAARCFHTPVYVPTTGEVVTIVAEAVNEDGIPIEADSVEIYLDLDRGTPQAVETQASRATLEYPPSASFAYSCLAKRGTREYFSGWKRVGVDESNIDFPAIPVRISGPLDERIDIVFFYDPDEYSSYDDPAFIEDVGLLLQDGYFTIPWFIKWQKFFNFWIGKTPANTGPQPDSERCLREAPDKFKKKKGYSFADSAGIVHRSPCRDNAGAPGLFTVEMELSRLQVVAHESGHRPFGLADEYCCDGGYFTKQLFGPPFPNIFKEEPGCRSAAIDGGFDPDACRSFTEDRPFPKNRDWWLHEQDKRLVQLRDLMQEGGCASATPSTTKCDIQLPMILGAVPDPNGLYACPRPIETFYIADVGNDGYDKTDAAWICRRPGSASEAVWQINQNDDGTPRRYLDRFKIGDSERRRMFWMLNKCLAGRC